MKIKQQEPASLQQQTTPMIDVTFQLLTFFMFTLKIVGPEGDFNINMPPPGAGAAKSEVLPDIKVRLVATPDGELASLRLGERQLGNDPGAFQRLNNEILKLIGGANSARSKEVEVEIDADYHLNFDFVVKAIGACTGRLAPDGKTIIRYVEKIKFAPPKTNPEA
jgi:biopolymer transport protein ExbD